MIKEDFYAGTSPTDIDLEWTGSLTSLAISDKTVDPFNAYYMGEAPNLWVKRGTFTVTGSDDARVYHLTTNTAYKNKWFYGAVEVGTSGLGMQWNPSGPQWMGSYKLLNSFKPYYYNNFRHFDISLRMYDYSNTATLANGEIIKYATAEYTNSNTIQLGVNEIWDLFNEDGSFTATFNGVDYSIKMSMWDNEVHAFKLDTDKYAFVKTIDNGGSAWSPSRTGIYHNNYDIRFNVFNTVDCTGIENPAKYHLAKVFCSDAVHNSHYNWMLRSSTDMLRCPSGTNYNNATYDVHDGDEIVGWFYDADVSKYVMDWCNAHPSAHVLTSTGVAIKDDGGNDTLFDWGFDFPVWYTNIHGPITKTATTKDNEGNTVTPDRNSIYYENYDAVPIFNKYNVFQYREKPSSIVDLNFFKKLQPWQLYGADISDDEYDPDAEDTGSDPTEGTGFPDKGSLVDEGDPNGLTAIQLSHGSMTEFYVLTVNQFETLRATLAQTYSDVLTDPTDTNKFAYLVGKLKQVTGGDTEFETSDSNFIKDYIVSCRFYPFDLSATTVDNNTALAETTLDDQIPFGFSGASITQAHSKLNYTHTWIFPQIATVNNRAGDNNINSCTFLDFEPYAKYSIMLPFIGEFELPAHSVVCANIMITYFIDFSAGTCCAAVTATKGFNKDGGHDTTLLVKTGNLSSAMSITGNDIVRQTDQMNAAQLQQVASRTHSIVSDINANMPAVSSIAKSTMSGAENGGIEGALTGLGMGIAQDRVNKVLNLPNRYEEIVSNNIRDTLADVNKTQASRDVPFQITGGSNASVLAKLHPRIRVQRAVGFIPGEDSNAYGHTYGFPFMDTVQLKEIKGFFQCANPDISTVSATATEYEKQLINEALRNGSFMTTK